MSDFNVFDDSDPQAADKLLDELESIKGVLDDGAAADIPLLDDMVVGHLDDNTTLLNLDHIFEDDEIESVPVTSARPDVQFPRFNLDTRLAEEAELTTTPEPAIKRAAPPPKRVRPDYSREVLIQELVDEFIPQIEAALRERLNHLDTTTLKSWKDSV